MNEIWSEASCPASPPTLPLPQSSIVLSSDRTSPTKRRRWGRQLLWLFAAIAASAYIGPFVLKTLRPDRPRDFVQEWASARNFLCGFPIYESQEVSLKRYLGIEKKPGQLFLDINTHPPLAVLLTSPLARLDYPDAFFVWSLLGFACLALTLTILSRELSITWTWSSWLPFYTLSLTCSPLLTQLFEGQLNLIILLLVVGCWAADRSGRSHLAGGLLGAASAVKLFPAFFFLYFILKQQWRSVAAGIVTLSALTLLTLVVFGLESHRDYVLRAMPTVNRWRSCWGNISVFGFWSKLFDPHDMPGMGHVVPLFRNPLLARVATLVCQALLVISIAPVILRARSKPECDDAFALCAIVLPLLTPAAWNHYLMIFALPCALLWRKLPRTGLARWDFRILLTVLWLPPSIWWRLFLPERSAPTMPREVTPFGTICVLSIETYAILGLLILYRVTTCSREDGIALSDPDKVDPISENPAE